MFGENKDPTPGPGSYINPNDPINSSMQKGMMNDQNLYILGGNKNAAFGSDMKDRFQFGMFDLNRKDNPGPG